MQLLRDTYWSPRTEAKVEELVRGFKPDLIHVHNTFPLISPSLYWAAAKHGVPVVQTLHNFRLFCLGALFLRENRVCEDCMGRAPWRGIVHGCYRESISQSAVLAGMLSLHRGLGTWKNKVTRYIALNDFCRNKFIQGGLPAERLVVKPNFVDFPAPKPQHREGFLFVGRLSLEKGINVLADCARRLPHQAFRVAGTGPEAHQLEALPNVELLGALSGDQVRAQMQKASALLMPSIWHENFPRTLVEAFASGLPVIASRVGALADLVDDDVNGLLFSVNDGNDLAAKVRWAAEHPNQLGTLGKTARAHYEAYFTADANYKLLLSIYADAIHDVAGSTSH
jgi:glycosyltransferase involved in cell wall biosynthesis